MIRRLRRCSLRQGFSLVDVMIGMAVLAIAIASAYEASIQSSRITATNRNLTAAVSLAESKIEELRNAPFSTVVNGADENAFDSMGVSGGIYTRSWTVADNTPEPNLKTVTVRVQWQQWGDTPRSYTLTSVIAP